MGCEDKLCVLWNIVDLGELLNMCYIFFLYLDNLIFDINLVLSIVYWGIKNILLFYELIEEIFFK